VAAFRYFTSHVKRFRKGRGKTFSLDRGGGPVLKGEGKEKARALPDEGKTVSEMAQALAYCRTVCTNPFVATACISQKKSLVTTSEINQAAGTNSERSERDSAAAIGYANTRTGWRQPWTCWPARRRGSKARAVCPKAVCS
jgi:hypothetical protein